MSQDVLDTTDKVSLIRHAEQLHTLSGIINRTNDEPRIHFKERFRYLNDNFDLEKQLEKIIFLSE